MRAIAGSGNANVANGLNPYSNGICSMSEDAATDLVNAKKGLNPYSNGICSMSVEKSNKEWIISES